MRNVIVGTAGHIDHGKTALVKLLTGIDADRLKEEQERGITIDLGFANLDLDEMTRIGFVDVPGHERFVKNMLAGVGGIDVVMLVVAADESIMPQTREHLEICSLLHVPYGLTAVTKIDTVESELAELVEMEIRDYLKHTFLGGAPIVRVSARTGEGKTALIDALRGVVADVPPKNASGVFRLPVDRCFTMKGFGTVVTGTLVSGTVRRDQEVQMLPSGKLARVRGLQVHSAAVEMAEAGQRTAINLQGVDVRDVHRGMVLTDAGLFEAASVFDCHLELLSSATGPIKRRKRIRFHVGTAEIMGYVSLLGEDAMAPGEDGFAQIRLEEPVLALPGDRFIVRQYSPMVTIGGGEILAVGPRKHRLGDGRVIEALAFFKSANSEDRLMAFIEDAGLGTRTIPDLVTQTGEAAEDVRRHLSSLREKGGVRLLSDAPFTVVSASAFDKAAAAVMAYVLEFHDTHPLLKGVSREELKTRLFRRCPSRVFHAVMEHLSVQEEITVAEDIVHAFGRKVTLEAAEEKIREHLDAEFRRRGLEVASPEEIITGLGINRQAAQKILRLMVQDGTLAKVSEDLMVHRSLVDEIVAALRSRKDSRPTFGVGEFKDLVGVSRKYAIPLLEYLDREGVTRRVGSDRKIL